MASFHKSALTYILRIITVCTADKLPGALKELRLLQKCTNSYHTRVTIQVTAPHISSTPLSVSALPASRSRSAGHWAAGTRSQRGCSSLMLHTGELLPPVGEVAEGVRAGEVWGGGSHLQGEHVVHHLPQTYVTEERSRRQQGIKWAKRAWLWRRIRDVNWSRCLRWDVGLRMLLH